MHQMDELVIPKFKMLHIKIVGKLWFLPLDSKEIFEPRAFWGISSRKVIWTLGFWFQYSGSALVLKTPLAHKHRTGQKTLNNALGSKLLFVHQSAGNTNADIKGVIVEKCSIFLSVFGVTAFFILSFTTQHHITIQTHHTIHNLNQQ